MAKAFTPKQLKFIELWNGNATQTAEMAGYKQAKDAGSRCWNNVDICRAIQERRTEEIKPLVATRMDRQKFWTDVMQGADEKIEARLKASELLGRSEADFLEKTQHSGDKNNPIVSKWEVEVVHVNADT